MSACATPGKTRSFLCSLRLWLSKLESACLSDSCCTRVLLEEGLSARGEKELLDSRHLSLFWRASRLSLLPAGRLSPRRRRCGPLGETELFRSRKRHSTRRASRQFLPQRPHAGETELFGSGGLCSSQRASRSRLSRRARARTWCPPAQRTRRNGASRLEKTLFFSACFTLVSIATCARWDLVSACAALEEKRSF